MPWLTRILVENWDATTVASRGQRIDASVLPGFVAITNGRRIGLITYRICNDQCEIVTLNSNQGGIGIGTALLESVVQIARKCGCRRLWLITTNDNLDAIRFYSRRGMRLVAVHLDAIVESRKLKPSIPQRGSFGIPLQDELEFELILE